MTIRDATLLTFFTVALGTPESWAGALCASDPAAKAQYSIFNQTPDCAMREFSLDRPDKTESPYSVDAGHFQYEATLVSWIYDDEGDSHTSAFEIAAPNLKVGLTNDSDLQFIFSSYKSDSITFLPVFIASKGSG